MNTNTNSGGTNNKTTSYTIIIIAVLIVLIGAAAYLLFPQKQKTEAPLPTISGKNSYESESSKVRKTVGDFYKWYASTPLNILDNTENTLNEALKKEFINKNFVEGAKARIMTAGNNKFDILTCTSHKPKSFSPKNMELVEYAAGETKIHIKADIGIDGHYTDVRLQKENDKWVISSITCPIVPNIISN